ncbi:MAG: hypothetical protein B6U73_04180 [Desulfurococcales archaeon ex4484_204]|nr:MAG: hypothetical protein B6U73_04180 [Desulfurococcales archaeon ex4484_204]
MSCDRVYCELQVSIPYGLYLGFRRRYSQPLGNNVAGVDVNRANLAIVDRRGVLRDIKTLSLSITCIYHVRDGQRRSLLRKVVHDVLKNAYFHGV